MYKNHEKNEFRRTFLAKSRSEFLHKELKLLMKYITYLCNICVYWKLFSYQFMKA